jgi:hypothetical protein
MVSLAVVPCVFQIFKRTGQNIRSERMKIEITIGNRQVLIILLFIIAASAVGLVMAYGGSNPDVVGHTWGEMLCDKCISTTNIADNSVTGAKILDGSITNSDIVSTLNSDTVDSKHAADLQDSITCGWTGWSAVGCTGTCYGYYYKAIQLNCLNGKVIQAQVADACTYCG